MSRARLAIAGAGAIGRRHAGAIRACDAAVLAALIDPAPAAAQIAAELGVPLFASLDQALDARLADGIILATPNHLHVQGGLACIGAGVPALVEKPLDVDVAAARRLVETGEAAGVPVLTGHHRRYNPLIEAAHRTIAEGRLGRVVSAHAMFWLTKPDDYYLPEWRRQAGAGPVFLNLIHDLDLMRHLVGEVRAVQAAQSSRIRGHAVEDSCVIAFEFANGALGTANVSDTITAPWSWELTAAENPDYPATGQSCYQIGGTEGSLELPSGRLWHQAGPRSWTRPISATMAPRRANDPLVVQIAHFVRVIRGEEAPRVTAREGLRTLELIAAIKAAADSGRRVELGEG